MKSPAKFLVVLALTLAIMHLRGLTDALAAATSQIQPALPDFDARRQSSNTPAASRMDHRLAVTALKTRVPDAMVDFDDLVDSPAWVRSAYGFLANSTGSGISAQALNRYPVSDPYRLTRAFLDEHRDLFGHGSEALDAARITREFTTPRNGLHTVVWEQQLDDIPVFEALLISHTTKRGELVSLSSHFIPSPPQAAAAGATNSAAGRSIPALTAQQAVMLAVTNIGESLDDTDLSIVTPAAGADQHQTFSARTLRGATSVSLVWFPMDRGTLRLCWQVILMSRARGEMFTILIDAHTGEPLLRRSLTENISPASYRVFTTPSAEPFTVGYPTNLAGAPTVMGLPTPSTNQLPEISRTLVTTSAYDTNASPAGWVPDGTNITTSGNNVSAYLDVYADDRADIPAPQASTNRVFDFPLDLTQDPVTNGSASVVNLFYWNNWMHDRLYELGFTESAGNFQVNNFGRGGVGGDPVEAEGLEGYYTSNIYYLDNASFSTPPDGMPGIMRLFAFAGPTPARDSGFDTEVVLHEYTHGLSNRRVGGGVGIDKNGHPQSGGLGEGWSDFYSLALLSQPTDSLAASYPEGPYVSYLLFNDTGPYDYNQNYYFGIRRYPYCTNLNVDPGTFKDIDPSQASTHPGVPINPVIADMATEIHNQGEIWCATLWDARANLINQYGFTNGNHLILQLVTDAMNLTPANPTFIQARDAVYQADLVDNGGVNYQLLAQAFAKRGMGYGASAPASITNIGVVESFIVPDNLLITPAAGLNAAGAIGGPISPSSQNYALVNTLTNSMAWTASASVPWITLSATNGVLPGMAGTTNITASFNGAAFALPVGSTNAIITFTDLADGSNQIFQFNLTLSMPPIYYYPLNADPGWPRQGQWAFGQPTGQGGTAHGNPDPTSGPTGPDVFGVNLNGDYSTGIGSPYYLTAGPFNLTGCSNVALQFERWLNSDIQPYVIDTIDVSPDGTNWNIVFENSTVAISDSSWTNVQYDISSFADNQPAVYVRWGYQVAQASAFAYSGWNIDDISLLGTIQIAVTMPASAQESAHLISGQSQVSVPHPSVYARTFQLTSSSPSHVTVPSTVTILAGQTNALFNIGIIDDGQLEGTQVYTVTATSPGYANGSANIAIYDAEIATLAVSLPASATEGDGSVPGSVSMSGVPVSDVTVNLASSDPTSLSVPATVVIPAGQTNVPFSATVIQDNLLRGDRAITVTASVINWTNGVASILIHDNKSTNLMLSLPAQARESNGQLPNAGTVTIGGLLTNNLTVSLVSSNTAKLTVPSSVLIPAGQTSAVFNVTLVSGNPPHTPLFVSVAASAPGLGGGFATMDILDNQTPPAPFNPHPLDMSTTNPLVTTLSWSEGIGEGVETLVNGGFETGDFTGWFTPVTNAAFVIDDGTVSPPSGDGATPPYYGNFSALADQIPPTVSSMYQTVTLPTNVTSILLSWVDRIRNYNFAFNTNQQFRVEVRDTNDVVLQTAFCTQPGDTNLANWTLRSADLTALAGRTVRIAFIVNAGLSYLDVDLDNVSVRASNLPPPTYSVYFGTNATPGPAQFLGTTGNTFWHLSQPAASLTTYYWQIVASRANQTPGPIWQFSALPTFLVSNIVVYPGSSGITNAVFNVTLSDTNVSFVSVNYATADGTATNPVDYISTNGTLYFTGGVTNQTVPVIVNGQTNLPVGHVFYLVLSSPSGAAIGTPQAAATILNPNSSPVFTSIQLSAGQVALSWTTVPGKSYRVQYETNFAGGWSSLAGDVAATNTISSKTDTTGLATSRYYRIMVLP